MSKGLLLHRAFSLFVFNRKHELLLQQRSASKITFPLVWTNTCCSHPLFKEEQMEGSPEDGCVGVRRAAQRKALHELGIRPEQLPLEAIVPVARIHYRAHCGDKENKWGEHEVDYCLFATADVDVELNPEEAAAVRSVTQEELRALVAQADDAATGITLSPWFRLIQRSLLHGWWDKLEEGKLGEAVDMDIKRLGFD